MPNNCNLVQTLFVKVLLLIFPDILSRNNMDSDDFDVIKYKELLSPFGRKVFDALTSKNTDHPTDVGACDFLENKDKHRKKKSKSLPSCREPPPTKPRHVLIFNPEQSDVLSNSQFPMNCTSDLVDLPKTYAEQCGQRTKTDTVLTVQQSKPAVNLWSTSMGTKAYYSNDVINELDPRARSPDIAPVVQRRSSPTLWCKKARVKTKKNKTVIRNEVDDKADIQNNTLHKPCDNYNIQNDEISWNDMFDTILLPETSAKNTNLSGNEVKKCITESKPKDASKISSIPKIVKKRKPSTKHNDTVPNKKRNLNDKDKIRKPHVKLDHDVMNWVNNINLNNSVEKDFEINTLLPNKKANKSVNVKQKKVIQSTLANKDGVMKFKNPKKESKHEGHTMPKDFEALPVSTPASGEKLKLGKSKTKFKAPIKSQLPVKDVAYKIITIDDVNGATIASIEDDCLYVVLMYSNGFCQLNKQYTDDTCKASGILAFDGGDRFFIMEKEQFTENDANIQRLVHLLCKRTIVCFDAKSILIYLTESYNIDLYEQAFDIMDTKIGGSLVDPEHLVEDFSQLQRLLSFRAWRVESSCGRQRAACHLAALAQLWPLLRDQLHQHQQWDIFTDIEMKITHIVADMEFRGISVDTEKLQQMERRLSARLAAAERACHGAAGRVFSVRSAAQLRDLLYGELRLHRAARLAPHRTPATRKPSTCEAMLRALAPQHALPRLVLGYRRLHKARATFVAGVAARARDGVVRPVWEQMAAATGRMAAHDPNLQAIPKTPFSLDAFAPNGDAESEKLNFRSVYVARPGCTLLAADFRQVECRVFALAAGDAALGGALAAAPDLFRHLAALWLAKPEAEVSSADRERTKRIVYASLYGAGPVKLAEILRLPHRRTLEVIASFHRTFPALQRFASDVWATAAARGAVCSLRGRRRRLAATTADTTAAAALARRQAVNHVIQGTAADLCKAAMSAAAAAAAAAPPPRARLLLQIHDELVWETAEDNLEHVARLVKAAMESCGAAAAGGLRAAGAGAGAGGLPVALSAGRCWGDMRPLALSSPHPTPDTAQHQ